jgi:hypothetical protein
MYTVKQALDGLTFPSGVTFDGTTAVPNLQAFISVPQVAQLTTPTAFVWGGYFNEKRRTMAGQRATSVNTSSGFRRAEYRMDVIVRYAIPHNTPILDSVFPVIVDSVMERLRGIPMPQALTDPQTGKQSTMVIVGEDFDVQYGQVYQLADLRYWLYGAKITTRIIEDLQQ